MWHPIDDSTVPDTTWLFTWPKVCRDLLDFLEGLVYLPTSGEEYTFRQAIRNSTTPEEILMMKPWNDSIKMLNDGLRAMANPDTVVQDTNPNITNDDDPPAWAAQNHMQLALDT